MSAYTPASQLKDVLISYKKNADDNKNIIQDILKMDPDFNIGFRRHTSEDFRNKGVDSKIIEESLKDDSFFCVDRKIKGEIITSIYQFKNGEFVEKKKSAEGNTLIDGSRSKDISQIIGNNIPLTLDLIKAKEMVDRAKSDIVFFNNSAASKRVDASKNLQGLKAMLNAAERDYANLRSFELSKKSGGMGFRTAVVDSEAIAFEQRSMTLRPVVVPSKKYIDIALKNDLLIIAKFLQDEAMGASKRLAQQGKPGITPGYNRPDEERIRNIQPFASVREQYKQVFLGYRRAGYVEGDSSFAANSAAPDLEIWEKAAREYQKTGDLDKAKSTLGRLTNKIDMEKKPKEDRITPSPSLGGGG